MNFLVGYQPPKENGFSFVFAFFDKRFGGAVIIAVKLSVFNELILSYQVFEFIARSEEIFDTILLSTPGGTGCH